jgi:hypothetical protein
MKEIKYIILLPSSGSGTVIIYGSGSGSASQKHIDSNLPVRYLPEELITCHLNISKTNYGNP